MSLQSSVAEKNRNCSSYFIIFFVKFTIPFVFYVYIELTHLSKIQDKQLFLSIKRNFSDAKNHILLKVHCVRYINHQNQKTR